MSGSHKQLDKEGKTILSNGKSNSVVDGYISMLPSGYAGMEKLSIGSGGSKEGCDALGKNLAYFYEGETPVKAVKSRENLGLFLSGLENNPKKFDNSVKLVEFMTILMDFANDIEASIDMGTIDSKDVSIVLRAISICLSVKDLFIVNELVVKDLYLGILFNLAKLVGIKEEDLSVAGKEYLNSYLGERKLLLGGGVMGMKFIHTYSLNIPYLKHSVWSGLELYEENAIFDLLRLIVSVVPQDKGKSFGYSKIHTTMSGDGIVIPHSVTIAFEDVEPGVTGEFLEHSLKTLINQIKKGILQARDELKESNYGGWDNISTHFYDKCQDSFYLTQKIGKKMLSVYGQFKLNNERE